MAVSLPYRPPDEVVKLLNDKGGGYFARLGHGREACPEIYSAGENFLLSGGGANRGQESLLVARPITLLLDDGADDLSKVFHLAGPGNDFRKWNNTGVHQNFACAAGPVYAPTNATAIQTNGQWKLYAAPAGVLVVAYSIGEFGLIGVFESGKAETLLTSVSHDNPDEEKLRHEFQFPEGRKLTYDVLSPKNQWVMISDDDKLLDRDFDQWPQVKTDWKNPAQRSASEPLKR
jgi:hypothetical protein